MDHRLALYGSSIVAVWNILLLPTNQLVPVTANSGIVVFKGWTAGHCLRNPMDATNLRGSKGMVMV